jgi:hypothetical protein
MSNQNSLNLDIALGGGNKYYFPALSTCTLASTNKSYTSQAGSRLLNTVYANTSTATSLMVMATVRCAISATTGTAYVQALADTSSPPTTSASGIVGIQAGLNGEDNTYQLCFVVGTNTNYIVTSTNSSGTTTLGSWYELIF